MSAEDAFDLKQQFLHDAEVALRRQLTTAERVLLKLVFEKIIDQLSSQGGQILSGDENFDVLNRLGAIYQQFIQDQLLPLTAKLATSFLRLPSLNGDYFQAEINTPSMQASVRRIVSASTEYLRSKLGITSTGKVKAGSYLSELTSDPTVRDGLRRIMSQAIDEGWDLSVIRDRVRDYLIGGPATGTGRLQLRKAGALEKRFEQFAFDALQAADRNVGKQFAVELGLQLAVYRGGIIEETRKFCCQLNGKAWTIEEMEAFDKEEWSGKKGSVQIDGGGYNCRHTWRYVNEVRALRLRPDLEEGTDGKLRPKPGATQQAVNDDCEDAKGTSTLGDVVTITTPAPVAPTLAVRPAARGTVEAFDEKIWAENMISTRSQDLVNDMKALVAEQDGVLDILAQYGTRITLRSMAEAGPSGTRTMLRKTGSRHSIFEVGVVPKDAGGNANPENQYVNVVIQKGQKLPFEPVSMEVTPEVIAAQGWHEVMSEFGPALGDGRHLFAFRRGDRWLPFTVSTMSRLKNMASPTVTHELAHIIHNKFDPKRTGTRPRLKFEADTEGITLSDAPTMYGSSNWSEFWTETFTSYVYANDWLKTVHPRVFRFFEHMLEVYGIDKSTIRIAT